MSGNHKPTILWGNVTWACVAVALFRPSAQHSPLGSLALPSLNNMICLASVGIFICYHCYRTKKGLEPRL